MNKTEFVKIFYPKTMEPFQKKKYENRYVELCEYVETFSPEQEISFDEFRAILEKPCCKSASLFYEYRTMLKFVLEAHGFSSKSFKNLRKIKFEDIYFEEDMERTYFGSEDELFYVVKYIISHYSGSDVDGIVRHVNFDINSTKIICGLLWYGFELISIRNLLIEDIDFKNCCIFNNKINEVIDISSELIKDIKRFLDNREINSRYLFCNKNGDITENSTIGKRLKILNGFEEHTLKTFSARNIYYSGMFERVYLGVASHDSLLKDKKIKYEAWVKTYKE